MSEHLGGMRSLDATRSYHAGATATRDECKRMLPGVADERVRMVAICTLPVATAVGHTARNLSSRLRTRTIIALMLLDTAWIRLRRAICCCCSTRWVMSRLAPR